jgi:hypothetical protein
MKMALAAFPGHQTAGGWHIIGIIFDHLTGLQNLPHVPCRDPPLEHALDGVNAEDDTAVSHI